MKSYLLVIFAALVVWGVVQGLRKLGANNASRVPKPATTPSTPHTPVAAPHHKHDHKKKGVLASVGAWFSGLTEQILKLVVIAVCVLGCIWFVFRVGIPGLANAAAKEAGGPGHPQYEERMEARRLASTGPFLDEPVPVGCANATFIVRRYNHRIKFKNDTYSKVFTTQSIRFSYIRPDCSAEYVIPEAVTSTDGYYFWTESPQPETMDYEWIPE